MATHHSKTRRAKSPHDKIVVPSWDDVWGSFEKDNQITTIEAMNAEGWKTVEQAMDVCGLSNSRIYNMIREGLLERSKRKTKELGATRAINFVRPKI